MTRAEENRLRGLFRSAGERLASEQWDMAGPDGIRKRSRRRALRRWAAGGAVAAIAGISAVVVPGMLRPELTTIGPEGATGATGFSDFDRRGEVPLDLADRNFYSVSVTEAGVPLRLPLGAQVELEFNAERGSLSWYAGCNRMWGPVWGSSGRLRVGEAVGTLVKCEGERDWDRWIVAFLESEPPWTLEEDRLTLTSGSTIIELEEQDLGVGTEEFVSAWNRLSVEAGHPELLADGQDIEGGVRSGLEIDLTPEGFIWLTLTGRVHLDGQVREVTLGAWSEEFRATTRAAWRVFVQAVVPGLGAREADSLLEELGVPMDERDSSVEESDSTVRVGDVEFRLTGHGGTDSYSFELAARPFTNRGFDE